MRGPRASQDNSSRTTFTRGDEFRLVNSSRLGSRARFDKRLTRARTRVVNSSWWEQSKLAPDLCAAVPRSSGIISQLQANCLGNPAICSRASERMGGVWHMLTQQVCSRTNNNIAGRITHLYTVRRKPRPNSLLIPCNICPFKCLLINGQLLLYNGDIARTKTSALIEASFSRNVTVLWIAQSHAPRPRPI